MKGSLNSKLFIFLIISYSRVCINIFRFLKIYQINSYKGYDFWTKQKSKLKFSKQVLFQGPTFLDVEFKILLAIEKFSTVFTASMRGMGLLNKKEILTYMNCVQYSRINKIVRYLLSSQTEPLQNASFS